jgi:hypothetical protein
MKPCYIARNSMAAYRQLGGEMIIMSAINSKLCTLNEVASLIWKAADGATSLQDIVEGRVCAEFDVDPAVALADAESLVGELAEQGLLLIADYPVEQRLDAEQNP